MTTAVSLANAEDEVYWLALRMVPGLGDKKAVPLVKSYRSPHAVFRASASELMAAGLSGATAHSIASGCTFDDAAEQSRLLRKSGAVLVPCLGSAYPESLQSLYDPPLLLFCLGDTALLRSVMVGVVGTRRPSPYGTAAADRLSADLALAGATVVSGMARGIDTAAHWAALKAGGTTAAVFGSGVDHIYPAENRRLAAEIATRGVLISEFPMGTPGHPQNFPIRNRIISGLSAGVVVVEGAQYSGSAITARLAMEQGKEVFAVPGNITSKLSFAPNLLIKQGAHLVQAATDILDQLPLDCREALAARRSSQPAASVCSIESAMGPNAGLGRDLLALLRADEAVHIDGLIGKLDNWTSSEVIAALFDLELCGAIRQLPGKNFVKVWGESTLATSANTSTQIHKAY
ncbi:MAG: DNA-protecting protein DprA [Acidobacteria bacterium]|nr:DNA-protecting protein DprA [Acidobacteriota bacterium]